MTEEWKEVKLEEVVSILGDGLHRTPKYDEKGDYYFINGNNLVNGKIILKYNTKKTSKTEYEKYKKDLNKYHLMTLMCSMLKIKSNYNQCVESMKYSSFKNVKLAHNFLTFDLVNSVLFIPYFCANVYKYIYILDKALIL